MVTTAHGRGKVTSTNMEHGAAMLAMADNDARAKVGANCDLKASLFSWIVIRPF